MKTRSIIHWMGTWLLWLSVMISSARGGADFVRETPKGQFERYVLRLDTGYIKEPGDEAEPLVMHLPCRAGTFVPQGWWVKPGTGIIKAAKCGGLVRKGSRLTGTIRHGRWFRDVAIEDKALWTYEIDAVVEGSSLRGTFSLICTIDEREARQTGKVTGRILAREDMARGNEFVERNQCTQFRGVDGTGNVESGREPIATAAAARLVWLSEEKIPHAAWNTNNRGLSGGCGNLSVRGGRVYLIYYIPSGEVVGPEFRDGKANPRIYPGDKWRQHWLVEADDVVHCFDAATGATLWKSTFKLRGMNTNNRGPGLKTTPHATPCVADGKVFAPGSTGDLYCLNEANGDLIWETVLPIAKQAAERVRERALKSKRVMGVSLVKAHPLYDDGVVVCADGLSGRGRSSQIAAFDASTGDLLWTYGEKQDFRLGSMQAPVSWIHTGQTRVIAASDNGTACLDFKTGRELWRHKEARHLGSLAPIVSEDYLVLAGCGKREDSEAVPVRAFRITPKGATQAWESDMAWKDKCIGVIRQGHVYYRTGATPRSSRTIACIELATGKLRGRVEPVRCGSYTSFTAGDGILGLGGGRHLNHARFGLVRMDPDRFEFLGYMPLPRKETGNNLSSYGWCTTAAFADGRLFLRTWDQVACYDLRLDERLRQATVTMKKGDFEQACRLFMKACRHEAAEVRVGGIAGLRDLGSRATTAIPLLIEIVRGDPAQSVRQEAVTTVARLAANQPGSVIGAAEKAASARARRDFMCALGKMRPSDKRMVDLAISELGNADDMVRGAAVHAIGAWGAKAARAAPDLAKTLQSRNIPLAKAAADVLNALGTEAVEAVPVLIRIIGSANPREDYAYTLAESALKAIGPAAVPMLAVAVEAPESQTAITAAAILEESGADAKGAIPALRRTMQNKNSRIAIAAARAAAAADPACRPEAIKVLRGFLSHNDAKTVDMAARALAVVGLNGTDSECDQVVQALVQLVESGLGALQDSAVVRAEHALQALASMGKKAKSAAPVLRKATREKKLTQPALQAWQSIMPGVKLGPPVSEEAELDIF